MEYKFKNYKQPEIMRNHLELGGTAPNGERIDVNSLYIERGGKPWLGVMGEYHFVRDSRDNWYRELCKMKAGGVCIVATYLFWIYHEETENEFDFSGDRDIRRFILDAERAGMDVVIRIGPWAHGECRNGGLPDWLLKKPYKLRDNNEEYMAQARKWYSRIYDEVKGLFYKDGGNIIGIQIENELTDKPWHLLALKHLAMDIGYDAPIWTVTGWNSLYGAKIPTEDFLPVFGGYEEAPWEPHTDPLPLSVHYVFDPNRNDAAIGLDVIGKNDDDGWRLPYERYPFVTCELGGGLPTTHHRRVYIRPMDVYAMSLVKLGSGNNLIGYYMYKGGINKNGKLSTLNETKATGYPNDYAALNYDFQAPLSAYGEVREHYRLTNMLHIFVNDFGDSLAAMPAVMPEKQVSADDLSSLRYSMRTDGKSGFVFVNHYQRLAKLEPIEDVVIDTVAVKLPPITVDGDVAFIMPFNMAMGDTTLKYATAQPLCSVGNTYFFVEIDGIEPKFSFTSGERFTAKAGIDSSVSVGDIRIITLTFDQARFARKLRGTLYIGENCDLYDDGDINAVGCGSYAYYKWTGKRFEEHAVRRSFNKAELILKECDAPFEPTEKYELEIGGRRALKWYHAKVTTPEGFVEIPMECDVAQLYTDGALTADNFWYGKPWRIPARLIYGKKAYIVCSELKNDFYREV
ncbi:MAG: beta-galactosidase [Clostridia bacterium]|nr:beta-galactosidase [Clostridia bacterium]